MAALEDPEHYVFLRGGKPTNQSGAPVALAKWTDVLSGAVLGRYMERIGLATGLRGLAAWRARRGAAMGGFRPGLSRAGKPVSDERG